MCVCVREGGTRMLATVLGGQGCLRECAGHLLAGRDTPPPYPSYLFWIPGAPISPPRILRDPGGFTSFGWLPGVGGVSESLQGKGHTMGRAQERRTPGAGGGCGAGPREHAREPGPGEMPGCSAPPKLYNPLLQGCCAAGPGLSSGDAAPSLRALLSGLLPCGLFCGASPSLVWPEVSDSGQEMS